MHTHGKSLADRGDGEELIETNVGGVHLTTTVLPIVPLLRDMGLGLLIML